jgi:hypothetical protein
MSTAVIEKTLTLTGTSALVVDSIASADPENPITKLRAKILAKRSTDRTEADQAQLEYLGWVGSLYLDDDERLIFPTYNVSRAMQKAGAAFKLGTKVVQGVLFSEQYISLVHEGPATLDAMYKDDRFRFRKMVNKTPTAAKPSMVVSVRPQFDPWSMSLGIIILPDVINEADVRKILDVTGKGQGIGNARRLGAGRFSFKLS